MHIKVINEQELKDLMDDDEYDAFIKKLNEEKSKNESRNEEIKNDSNEVKQFFN